MSRRNKRRKAEATKADPPTAEQPGQESPAPDRPEPKAQESPAPAGSDSQRVSVGDWKDRDRPAYRAFPGPRGVEVPLRVAFERSAYAELTAHAKESLDAEVCGVLVGQPCEDDEGPFLHVHALIRGASARHGTSHVTFTQETWTAIHQTLERDHPKRRIVGWYHSHPGFGVEFSDLDLFIQQNFFPAPTQIALVTDPLGGEIALCVNTAGGIKPIDRFWVDGREQRCRRPGPTVAPQSPAGSGDAQGTAKALEDFEARLTQVIRTLDEVRSGLYRFLTAMGVLIGLGVIVLVLYSIYSQATSRQSPPRLLHYVPVPVKIGDDTVFLVVSVTDWKVPPELNAAYVELERQRRLAAEKAAEEAAKKEKEAAEKEGQEEAAPTKPGAKAPPEASSAPAPKGSSPARAGAKDPSAASPK